MSRRGRLLLFGAAAPVLLGFLAWGLHGLPAFGGFAGRYGRLLTTLAVGQRHTTNVVAAVVFDYRGVDTLGEEFILFAAVTGVAFILRGSLRVKEQEPLDAVSQDATRVVGVLGVPVVVVVALWLVAFGYVTPGGGFQGGVVLGSAVLLVWLATSYRQHARLTPPAVFDVVEAAGGGGYALVGLAGLGGAGAYLANVLPLGSAGSLASGGTVAVLNALAAAEVAAAVVLLYREFLQEYVQTFPGVEEED